ncbi:MAG: DUF3168 domain-containing protein [Hyphomicrobiales bacterium]
MSNVAWDIQSAIYTLLTNVTPAIAAGGVHAPAGPDVAFPHIEIGDSHVVADDVQSSHGGDEFITLHVWSRPGSGLSFEEVKRISAAVKTALHGVSIVGDTLSYGMAWVQSQRFIRDPDGATLHGTLDVRVSHYS